MTPGLVKIGGKRPYDVRIDRTTKWGNPFIVGVHGTRRECVEKYQKWLPTQPHLIKALPELSGKVLGCHCGNRLCHGRVLLKRANPGVRFPFDDCFP